MQVPSAMPKNSENTRICKMALLAIDPMMPFGNTWVMKSRRFSARLELRGVARLWQRNRHGTAGLGEVGNQQ